MFQNSAPRSSTSLSPRARTRSLTGYPASSNVPSAPPLASNTSYQTVTPARTTRGGDPAGSAAAPGAPFFPPGFWGTSLVPKAGSRSTSVDPARQSSPRQRAQKSTSLVPTQQVPPSYGWAPPPQQRQQMPSAGPSGSQQTVPHFTQTSAQWQTIPITIVWDDWASSRGRFYASKNGGMVLYNDTADNPWDRQARQQGRKDCAMHARVCIGDRLQRVQIRSVAYLKPYDGRTVNVYFQRNPRRTDWTVYFPPIESPPRAPTLQNQSQRRVTRIPVSQQPPQQFATEPTRALGQRRSTPGLAYFRDLTPQEKQDTHNAFSRTEQVWKPWKRRT